MILFLLPLATLPIDAQEIPDGQEPVNEANLIKYNSSIILQNVGEINKKDGHFWAQFIIIIESDDVDFKENPPQLSFTNARNPNTHDEYIESHHYEVTVESEFFTEMNFYTFPFDSIFLTIIIEPRIPDYSDKIILVAKEHPIIDSSANVPGWEIVMPTLIF